ncbi:putative transcriptional regulator [Bacillus sp. TS-2]|nr:putative transcriptional regulator [Bacillus sp. TS-2]
MTSIGEKIKSARQAKKLTQQELADQLHISRSAISNWENERNYPDLQTIIHLSDVLEISLDQLLKEDKVLVNEIHNDQRKSKKRALALKIIFPVFILSLLTTAFLLFQEVSIVQNTLAPNIKETIHLENPSTGSEWTTVDFNGNDFLMLEGMFWDKEIINEANSHSTLEVQIREYQADTIIESFSLSPGESYQLDSLKNKVRYNVEVRGHNGTYFLNIY